jgi:hypothetical protein
LQSPHNSKINFIFYFEEALKFFVPIGIKGKTTTFILLSKYPNFVAGTQYIKIWDDNAYKPSQNKDFGSRSPAKTQRDKKAGPSFNPQVPRRKCPWGAYSSMSKT